MEKDKKPRRRQNLVADKIQGEKKDEETKKKNNMETKIEKEK